MTADLECKIQQYYSLKPVQYRVLKSATLTQRLDESTGEMRQNLSLVLSRDDNFSGEMLYLELFGVRNLELHQPSWSLVTLSNIEVIQAPPASKYDHRFVVRDAEDGVISCSCHDFYAAVG
jgi:hypothetical protein